jgi:hypothetical protein
MDLYPRSVLTPIYEARGPFLAIELNYYRAIDFALRVPTPQLSLWPLLQHLSSLPNG